MFRWCANCQRYLGEKPPFDNFALTHTFCDDCAPKLLAGGSIAGEPLTAGIYRDFMRAVHESDLLLAQRTLTLARQAGIPDLDLAVGILQPLLYEVGVAWAAGHLSVWQEHRISGWVEEVLAAMAAARSTPEKPGGILLLAAPGNQHTLGPRLLTLELAARGLAVTAVLPGMPLAEYPRLIERSSPRIVGISVGDPASLTTLEPAVHILEVRFPEVRFVAGGSAVRLNPGLRADMTLIPATDEFVRLALETRVAGVPLRSPPVILEGDRKSP